VADTFNQHLAKLIKHLTDAGVDTLAEMLAEERITADEKRSLQYQFCRGMNSAHFAMSEPKTAVRSSRTMQGDRYVTSTIESNIRMAAERVLDRMFGKDWRVSGQSLGPLAPKPGVDTWGGCFEALRKAVIAKPSEIERPEWANTKEE